MGASPDGCNHRPEALRLRVHGEVALIDRAAIAGRDPLGRRHEAGEPDEPVDCTGLPSPTAAPAVKSTPRPTAIHCSERIGLQLFLPDVLDAQPSPGIVGVALSSNRPRCL